MPNTYFQFKQFRIEQALSGMKVTTDGCLFGAWVADWIKKQKDQPGRILDVGTGTGLLTLMLAQVTKNCRIDAIEINRAAYEEAKENFSNSPWADRLGIFHTSVQQFETNQPYDLIICNPPFFKDNLKGRMSDKNQAIHSDSLPVEELAAGINRSLAENGVAFVMYPEWEATAFAGQMKLGWHLQQKLTVFHREGAKPLRVITAFGKKQSQTNETSLIIRETEGSYSKDFSRLLDSYYL